MGLSLVFYYKLFLHIYTDVTLNDTADEGTVRLVGGTTPLEGRVEIFLLGQWGTVCDYYAYSGYRYNWDLADATVVCHQLGYLRAVGAPRSAAFGVGSGPSWYIGVRCGGNMHNLNECSNNGQSGNACYHSQDAGVICSSELTFSLFEINMYTVLVFWYCHLVFFGYMLLFS